MQNHDKAATTHSKIYHRKKHMNYNIISVIAVILGSLGLIGHHAYPTTDDTKPSHSSTSSETKNLENKNSSTTKPPTKTKVQQTEENSNSSYPLHTNIITTIFWV